MCGTGKKPEEMYKTTGPAEPKVGSKWTYGLATFTVKEVGLKYFQNTDSNPTRYALVEDHAGVLGLITHAALRRDCKPWQEELKPVYVTVRKILSHTPCEEGIVALGALLGGSDKQDKAWQAVAALSARGQMDVAFKVSELYDWYVHAYDCHPSTVYLTFLAKVCNLIPEGIAQGPYRTTLKRLLGIPAE